MKYLELKSRIEKLERSGGVTNAHTKRALAKAKRRHDERADAVSLVDRRIRLQHTGGPWVNVRVNYETSSRAQKRISQGYHLIERRWASTTRPLRDGEQATALMLIDKLRVTLMSSEPHCIHTT